jgi:N-acetylmuramoyl-L-alanine amidase
MTRAAQAFLSLLLLFTAAPASAAIAVQNLRTWEAPDNTRLVFDLSAPVEHRLITRSDPPTVIVELDKAVLGEPLAPLDAGNSRLAGIQATHEDDGTLRVTIALKSELRPRSFVLKPAGPYGHRLVIDLYEPQAAEDEERAERQALSAAPARVEPGGKREFLIAIDAGHGGEDPGAIGRRYRTREKDVTLAIALELARLVSATPGMRPMLTRRGDYYVGLGKRYWMASEAKADLFVSIHADAVPHGMARGSSVYVLSERGATSALAKALADRENAADMVGGISFKHGDDQVLKVVMDMMQNKTMEYSFQLAGDILTELRRIGPVHASRVNQAGFMVLRSANVPSVLVETAFISNPSEEKKLRTPAFQREVAEGMLNGIRRYLARQGNEAPSATRSRTVEAHPAPPPRVLTREHVVRRGDTLSAIARQYRVHVETLRFFNGLESNRLSVGMRLRIPPEGT